MSLLFLYNYLSKNISNLKGVGIKTKKLLKKKNIENLKLNMSLIIIKIIKIIIL